MTREYDLIVKHGTVVTTSGAFRADVGVKDGTISTISSRISAMGPIIDASECYVLPGGVDVHTHLDAPTFDMMTADDFRSGTIAAAAGGTTTLIDFCQQEHGKTLAEGIAKWDKKAAGRAAIDYSYHMLIVDLREDVLAELDRLPDIGITSFKLFMSGKGGPMIDDLTLIKALDKARDVGALVMVHAENGDAVYHLQNKFYGAGGTSPLHHALSRPARIEAEATARAIALAEIVGATIYIVHVSCKEALEEVIRGKLRGASVLAETCTHYLYLTSQDLDQPDFQGAKFVFSPPARTQQDHLALWRALAHNLLETVSSDHSSTNFHGQKDRGRSDFRLIPNGLPGIEERMTMLFQGVVNGHISLSQFVDLAATRPARTFGLYPRKGAVAVGCDADLVVWNPNMRRTLHQASMHHAVDYTAYEGIEVQGGPQTVVLRGKVIIDRGAYVGTPGEGIFVKRSTFNHLNQRYAASCW